MWIRKTDTRITRKKKSIFNQSVEDEYKVTFSYIKTLLNCLNITFNNLILKLLITH